MARKQSVFEDFLDEMLELFCVGPRWLPPLFVLGTFVGFRWIIPWMLLLFVTDPLTDGLFKSLSTISSRLAALPSALVLFVWAVAEVRKIGESRRLDSQTGLASIQRLTWKQFEGLLAEAFRRQGYRVKHSLQPGPDGGVDIRLERDSQLILVQCKHWKRQQVGVQVVRELLGVMSSELADQGIVACSGSFTDEATRFAEKNHVQLIAGQELLALIREVRATTPASIESDSNEAPTCPHCGVPMTLRVAKKGASTGSEFWGCANFPRCRATKALHRKPPCKSPV